MSDIKDLVKAVNEILETCRNYGICDYCPYWDKENSSCIIQRETKAVTIPIMW